MLVRTCTALLQISTWTGEGTKGLWFGRIMPSSLNFFTRRISMSPWIFTSFLTRSNLACAASGLAWFLLYPWAAAAAAGQPVYCHLVWIQWIYGLQHASWAGKLDGSSAPAEDECENFAIYNSHWWQTACQVVMFLVLQSHWPIWKIPLWDTHMLIQ